MRIAIVCSVLIQTIEQSQLIGVLQVLWNGDHNQAYLRRAWCRVELLYAVNIPVLGNSDGVERSTLFDRSLAYACRSGMGVYRTLDGDAYEVEFVNDEAVVNIPNEQEMAALHPDFGYWFCVNGEWIKMYNPSYPQPALACSEIKKNYLALRDLKHNPNSIYGSRKYSKEECLSIGGKYDKGFSWSQNPVCYFDAKYPKALCTHDGECEGSCRSFPSKIDQKLGYSIEPGRCDGDVGRSCGGTYCWGNKGYFSGCISTDC